MKEKAVKNIVKNKYKKIALGQGCCCSGCGCDTLANPDVSKTIGYSDSDIRQVGDANMGLGCGNPVAFSNLKEGDTVLDLGAGAGIDCFLAARKVGPAGKVIGIDMTEEMVAKAKMNAKKLGLNNVEFMLGDIENLPIADGSIDIIISNCVINLAPDKMKVFMEALRVLKDGGKMYISDIVLLEELSEEQKNDENLLAGCVAGALLKDKYLEKISRAGFTVKVLSENKEISKQQYQGIPLESLLIEATK